MFTDITSVASAVPRGAFREQQSFGDVDSGLAGGIMAIILLCLSSVVLLLLRSIKRKQRQRNVDEHAAVALGNHPNVV